WPTYGLKVKRPPPCWEFCQESQGDCHDTHDCKRLAKRAIGDPRTKPDTSICVLGNFADRDVFIATHCALREDLGGGNHVNGERGQTNCSQEDLSVALGGATGQSFPTGRRCT